MLKPTKGKSRQEEVEDVRWLMSDPRGRRFVRRVIVAAGLFETVFRFVPSLPPEQWPTFNGAIRDFGQSVSDEVMNAAPAGFQLMGSDAALARQIEAAAARAEEDSKEEDNG